MNLRFEKSHIYRRVKYFENSIILGSLYDSYRRTLLDSLPEKMILQFLAMLMTPQLHGIQGNVKKRDGSNREVGYSFP